MKVEMAKITKYFHIILFGFVISVLSCCCNIAHAGNACDSLMRIDQLDSGNAHHLTELLEECKREVDDSQLGYFCARALNLYAWYIIQNQSSANSTQLLIDALNYCPADSGHLYNWIRSGLAGAYMYNEEYDKAEHLFMQILDYHTKNKNEDNKMIIYANLGTFYKKVNNNAKSLFYYQKAIDIASKSRKRDNYYCSLLVLIANLKEDSHLKPEMIHKSIDIAFKNNFTYLQSGNYLALAEYYCRQSDYAKAFSNADKAMQYAKRSNNIPDILDCLQLLGKIYNFQGNYELAGSCFRQLYETKEKYDTDMYLSDLKTQEEAYKLLLWCHDNMNSTSKGNGSKGYIVALSVLSFLFILMCLYVFKIKRQKKCSDKQSNVSPVKAMDSNDERNRMKLTIKYLTLFYDNQNVLLERVKGMLKQIKGNTSDQSMQLKKINNYITQNMLQERKSEFSVEINEDDATFYEKLSAKYPELTENEKKLALYLKMDLSSRDIALYIAR